MCQLCYLYVANPACLRLPIPEVQIRIETERGLISMLTKVGPEGSSCIKKYISVIQTIVPHSKIFSDQ